MNKKKEQSSSGSPANIPSDDPARQRELFGQRLSLILDNISIGVAVSVLSKDGKTERIFVNEKYYKMLGYTRGQYWQEMPDPAALVVPEDAPEMLSAVAELKNVGDSARLQFRAKRRDGRIVHLSTDVSVISFPEIDTPVQLYTFMDVTRMMLAKEQLVAQHEQISDMINAMPSGLAVIEVDPDDIAGSMRTTYHNDMFFSYSGYTKEEYEALLGENEMTFILEEDAPLLLEATKKMASGEIGNAAEVTVRCRTKDGGFRYLQLTGQLARRRGHICVINIAMADITAKKQMADRLNVSEEMFRIAVESGDRSIVTYDVKNNSCRVESNNLFSTRYGEVIENIPQSLISSGIVAQESAEELAEMFERIRRGEEKIRVSLLLRDAKEVYRWYECNVSLFLDSDQKPDLAILVFHNITEQLIKEAVYSKWQQSIQARPKSTYTLFRSNLSRDSVLDEQDGELIKIKFPPVKMSFNDRTEMYAEKYVYPDDRETYTSLLQSENLLAMFYRGEREASLSYREMDDEGQLHWRLLTVETVEYPNSNDVQAFLMCEDIDKQKRAELREKDLAELDPLTGALNRAAFEERVSALFAEAPSAQHAILMLDMDGFKLLNDSFGHAAGDQALQDVTAMLRSLIREEDILCRLGGDEFLVCLKNIPYDAVITKIAMQMCKQLRKAYSLTVQLSASIGVAVYPRDGQTLEELYNNADKALYSVKQSGKNSFCFFGAGAETVGDDEPGQSGDAEQDAAPAPRARRRMLIVDDNATNRALLENMFKDDYLIETAKNGTEAMIRLRHFGSSISIVLLDLVMPGMDGFEVLQNMQRSEALQTVPVIVVSGDDDRNTALKAIESGASDYVSKPVDPDLIRIRVASAVSKAENERLRAQNSYLKLQRDEELKFRTVLESTGTVVVEYNWRNHVFMYDTSISEYIAGNYGSRSLWTVFLADLVASSDDVKMLQEMLITLANDRSQSKDSAVVLLKTPSKVKHWFRVNIYKQVDTFGLAEKMIITFNDVHEEVISNRKLVFQATRDELTGLYNRAGFIQKAAELIAAKPAGYYILSCVDIEKFRVINDQYGTEKGDQVLRAMADTLFSLHSGTNSICCRVNSDNFAVLYPKTLLGSPVLERSHRDVAQLDGTIPPIRFSVGRCVVDDKSLDVSAVYDRASMAKETVKGRFDTYIATYDESMRTSLLRQQEIIGQMKDALADGQFEAWLQPQFNHATGRLSGAEALVRWRHPVEGIIPPDQFIPIFERNGFVYEVDKFVWEQSCALLHKWLAKGLQPVPISVNISRYDVFRGDLLEVITGLVKKYQLPENLLRLEITESAFSENTEQITDVVKRLVELGFVVEIDDFGSGYSSLNTLKDVPAQVLKMDMRFLKDDGNSQRGGSIIESVVRMAKWLGMSVIAEGVETLEQADFLKSIGCEYVQGYLYAHPMREEEYEKLFAEGSVETVMEHLNTLDTWNNNAFWNPQSMESLIFNSYVGGACIFEYQTGRTELLRANDGYIQLFQASFTYENEAQTRDFLRVLDPANRQIFLDAIEKAIAVKAPSECEMLLVGEDGTRLNIRVVMRQIASAGERSLIYAVVNDVSGQREAERRQLESARRLEAIMDSVNIGIAASVIRDGKICYLFANGRYYQLLGYERNEYDSHFSGSFDCIHPDDREETNRIIREANAAMRPYKVEFRVICGDGTVRWLSCSVTLVHLPEVEGTVHLAAVSDITAERETNELLKFLNDSAHDILAQPDSEMAMTGTLEKLRRYYDADRCYVVELDHSRMVTNYSYEVCAQGVTGMAEIQRALPFTPEDYWYPSLSQNRSFVVEDTAMLGIKQKALRQRLDSQGIRAIILSPLLRDGALFGFVGIDNARKAVAQVEQLTAVSDYIAMLLTKRDLSAELTSEKDAVLALVDRVPGGFVSIKLDSSGAYIPVFISQGFLDMVGMSREELRTIFGENVLAGVPPEDWGIVQDAGRRMRAKSGAVSQRFRIVHGGGGYIWIYCSGKAEVDCHGNTFLNVYFTDGAKQGDEEN